jgi:hypothetical protein
MKAVDFKSLVIGGLLVLLILGATGAVPWLPQEKSQRFALVPTVTNTFILDTATGQVWSLVEEPGHYANPNERARIQEFFGPKTPAVESTVDPNTPIP